MGDVESNLTPHPRPQLERTGWASLNGLWEFELDPESHWTLPGQVVWTGGRINVPFSPETAASGIGNTGFYSSCWYRRAFEAPPLESGQHLLLHFGAVDYTASVWVNGHKAVSHEGGYTPFHADITPFLNPSGPQTIVVRAEDDPHDLAKPRGKQDWQLEAHSIWYPRTTGIWQTVWLERVPSTWIARIRWMPSVENWEVRLHVRLGGERREGLRLNVKLFAGERQLVDDTYGVVSGEVHRRIALSDPGIDDFRNELLWSPYRPTLIRAQLQLWGGRGLLIDTALSYTALRSIGVQGDRFLLNGRPFPLRMVLDQGYWPESGLTAPSDGALRRDVELTRSMGFNAVRKHQKIEDPRYLFWADLLGLLVWEEMPSAYRYTRESIERLMKEWAAAIDRDISHPCIVAWVPFNESWGVPDLPDSPAQRHYVQALYHLTKTLDPTRPVVGNDGWEAVATDIIGIHDYEGDPGRIARRYGTEEDLPRLFRRVRPAGRMLLLDAQAHTGQPLMLTEFGGIAFSANGKTWGYSRTNNADEFEARYAELLAVVRSLPLLAGFCYTQLADTYQEANGLLYADRTPKIPIENIALATRGEPFERDLNLELVWRERIMSFQRSQYLLPADEYGPQEGR